MDPGEAVFGEVPVNMDFLQGDESMFWNTFWNTFWKRRLFSWHLHAFCFAAIHGIFLALGGSAFAAAAQQKVFQSPEAAVAALVQAVKENNTKEIILVLGTGSEPVISCGDAILDRQSWENFAKAYDEKNRLETFQDGVVRLFIGDDDWPFPFPIVKGGENWSFDGQAGTEEVLNRRIGENELSTIQVCLAIADSQREYADLMIEIKGQPEYAQKFESSKGEKDGLYWEASPTEKPSPLGPLVARARAEGYKDASARSMHYYGYLYKILKSQGKNANGGAYSYVAKGKMIGGFAVVAFPAVYRSTGVHTFLVNHEGAVYFKDLGINTAERVAAMTEFDPDVTWGKKE